MSYFFPGQQQQHHHHNHHHHHPQQHHPLPPTSSVAPTAASHAHNGGRSRRGPKAAAHNAQKQFRGPKAAREFTEAPAITAFRARFEAGRSFDLDDDLEFCPGLLTEDDLHSIHSSASDRSSLGSASPDNSPLQHQIQPAQQVTPSIALSPASVNAYANPNFNNINQMKIHQPSALRTRNAIPIVNPNTGMRVASPPSSGSPGGMVHSDRRRW